MHINLHDKRIAVGGFLHETNTFQQQRTTYADFAEAGDRTPRPDPEFDKMLADYRKEIGVTPRVISDEEIVERLIYSMVNEAAKILEEGIALRASDVDVVYMTGYGFPHYRGGPMFYADTVGLPKVLAAVEKFHQGYQGALWKPAPLLAKLAGEGKGFNT